MTLRIVVRSMMEAIHARVSLKNLLLQVMKLPSSDDVAKLDCLAAPRG